VDFNELGTSDIFLPSRYWFKGSTNHDAVIAHVEVKLAEPSENCAVVIVIWRCTQVYMHVFMSELNILFTYTSL
jgi:hypothetical protein